MFTERERTPNWERSFPKAEQRVALNTIAYRLGLVYNARHDLRRRHRHATPDRDLLRRTRGD